MAGTSCLSLSDPTTKFKYLAGLPNPKLHRQKQTDFVRLKHNFISSPLTTIYSAQAGMMASKLSEAMQRLDLKDGEVGANLEPDTIDDILFQQAPRKRRRQDPDELKAELEKKYLSPSTTFSTEWLNKLQQ